MSHHIAAARIAIDVNLELVIAAVLVAVVVIYLRRTAVARRSPQPVWERTREVRVEVRETESLTAHVSQCSTPHSPDRDGDALSTWMRSDSSDQVQRRCDAARRSLDAEAVPVRIECVRAEGTGGLSDTPNTRRVGD